MPPAPERTAGLARLAGETFDLLVIGGGINGGGIARDAVLRGLTVALVEMGDFASGTSSRSSRLVHGGLRYLEQGDLRLVRESSVERDRLRRLAPELVLPLEFLIPIYRGDPRGRFQLAVGLWVYDILAGFQNVGRHRMLGRAATLALEPGLAHQSLRGGALYYDCWTDDALLTRSVIADAERLGAVVLDHAPAVAVLHDTGGYVTGVRVADRESGRQVDVAARVVVNAAGPWVDQVRSLDDPSARPVLRPTKGVHLIVRRDRIGHERAILLRSPRDGRVVFVIPWQERSIIGPTDTDYSGDPGAVRDDSSDVDYLLEAVNHRFPAARLGRADVLATYAGVRPLVAPADAGLRTAQVSREEAIFVSPSGLMSLAGGKLTTFRQVAVEVVDRVLRALGKDPASQPSPSANLPIRPAQDRGNEGSGHPSSSAAQDAFRTAAE